MRFTKLRGQHILKDESVAERIAAELTPADAVLEVGPGLGVLTRRIIQLAGRYVGVELDPRFVQELKKEFRGRENVEFVEADILKINIIDFLSKSSNLKANSYKLISNLPYNITSAFFKKVLTEKDPPERAVVMIQNEVALRICPPTSYKPRPTSLLGLMCNLYAECEYLFRVPKSAFSPPPKVESAVIRLKPYFGAEFFAKWGIERARAEEMIAFIAVFFKNPRKMMSNALSREKAEAIKKALISIDIRPDARPADLALTKWLSLWKKFEINH
jgi:16S rRNA (adenine1518-N6/adenine1519-N6)-dimethyltransferase